VGSALLRAAAEFSRAEGAVRLVLSTELTNTVAQSVYEKNGWKQDTAFCVYQLAL
jgi:ribosomal protein S18 acetylase RimI-like enzyme